MNDSLLNTLIVVWFVLTGLSVAYIAYDLIVRTPEMKVMKWGWLLVTLYLGPVALLVYWFSCREPAPGTHERFIAPLWKQTVGSTIHCLAGDATGIIVAAVITRWLGLPMGFDVVIEYVAGFAFGLFVFQALFMKDMLGGSYARAVRESWYPEWVSMNAVMAGMIPVMVILMMRVPQGMQPTSGRFWGIMSLATLVGAVLAYPVNHWLVARKLKHGMGTERALGKGGTPDADPLPDGAAVGMSAMAHSMPGMGKMTMPPETPAAQGNSMAGMEMNNPATVSTGKKVAVASLTVLLLIGGVMLAQRYGGMAFSAEQERQMMPMGGRHAM